MVDNLALNRQVNNLYHKDKTQFMLVKFSDEKLIKALLN